MTKEQKVLYLAWGATIASVSLAIFVWLQGMHWHFSKYSNITYQLFPVFGLIAFSAMWSHYVASFLRQVMGVNKTVLKKYFELTSLLVLVAILLHPSVLWFQLWRDGYGLPPNSYLQNYVAPTLRWAAFLGSLSWFVFLSYELRRFFEDKNWWKYVTYASDAAMIGIFIHGLKLGKNLFMGWLPYVWYFYGITLTICLIYKYQQKIFNS